MGITIGIKTHPSASNCLQAMEIIKTTSRWEFWGLYLAIYITTE